MVMMNVADAIRGNEKVRIYGIGDMENYLEEHYMSDIADGLDDLINTYSGAVELFYKEYPDVAQLIRDGDSARYDDMLQYRLEEVAKDTWDKLLDVGEVNFGKYAKFDVLESRE